MVNIKIAEETRIVDICAARRQATACTARVARHMSVQWKAGPPIRFRQVLARTPAYYYIYSQLYDLNLLLVIATAYTIAL